MGNKMPKHPCFGCVFFKMCGVRTRTAKCSGRKTKRELKGEGRKNDECRRIGKGC